MAENINQLNIQVQELQQGVNGNFLNISVELASSGDFAVNICRVEGKLSNRLTQFQKGTDASLSKLESCPEEQEMDRNSNMLLIYGIEENWGDIYEMVLDLFNNKLNVQVEKHDLNYCFRLGEAVDHKKPRPIVVDFTLRWLRDSIFYAKKQLKGSKIVIMEKLTAENLEIYKIVRGIKEVTSWTKDGKVIVNYNGQKRIIATAKDLNMLLDEIWGGKNQTACKLWG